MAATSPSEGSGNQDCAIELRVMSGAAEHDQNPLPEVLISDAPEALHPIPELVGQDSTAKDQAGVLHHERLGPDMLGAYRNRQPNPYTWRSIRELLKSRWKLCVLVLFLVGLVIAAILGPVFYTAANRNTDRAATPSTSSETSTTSPSPPASTRGPAVGPIPPGYEPADYANKIDFVGIYQGQNWDFKLAPAANPVECCSKCGDEGSGCNAWFFDRAANSATSCSFIHGYPGPNQDQRCPLGRPDIIFNHVDELADNWGGLGPCGGAVQQ